MTDRSNVDGLKVVHLLYGPATEVLKKILSNKLYKVFLIENETKIKPKLKRSEVMKIFPLEGRNEDPVLQELNRDSLNTLLQLIGIPFSDRDDTETIHDLITVQLLQTHLDKNERRSKRLNENKKILNKAQWINMFPVTQNKWTNSFDITLLCFILFETFNVKPTRPSKNAPPEDRHTELGDDVERIRYYRNTVIHGNFLEKKDFSLEWDSICQAIIRRGGPKYRSIIEDIQWKDLDPYLKESYEELIKECQLQEMIVERFERKIEDAKCDVKETVHTAASQIQTMVVHEAQDVKREVREAESKIREKLTEQGLEMKNVISQKQEEYSSKINSSLQLYESKVTETMDKTMQKYTELVSEKVKQAQQTGANSDMSISDILSSVQEEIKPVIQKEMKEMTDNIRLNENDSLQTVMKDVHSLVQNMNDYIGTNRALDEMVGDNVTQRLLQAEEQFEEIAQKLETVEESLYQMKCDVQGFVTEMASTTGSILSIKDDMKDTKIYTRGANNQCEEVAKKLEIFKETYKKDMFDSFAYQKKMNEQLNNMNRDYQGLASDMTTASTYIKSMNETIEDTQTNIGEVAKQCEDVAQKLEMFVETHKQDQRDSLEHDSQMKEQLQGLASKMTTTSTDIKSMMVAIEDTQKQMRGVGKQCYVAAEKFEETHQQDQRDSSEHDKQMREQLDQINGDFQGLAREMTTTSTDIKSIKDGIMDTHAYIREGELAYGVNKNERRIVLIGKSGHGKSASGNTILGAKLFKSEADCMSVTLNCNHKITNRFGKTLLVVDTPGLYSTFEEEEAEIRKCIIMASPGPHTFLFITSTTKFANEHKNTFDYLVKLFSEELYKYTIVLFTRKELLEEYGKSVEEYLENIDPYLKKILKKCGNRYVFFNNDDTQEKRDEDVKVLLDMIDRMLIANGNSYYT